MAANDGNRDACYVCGKSVALPLLEAHLLAHELKNGKTARVFRLVRVSDVTGVSGTGIVADGVEFPDGVVALRWRGGFPTSVVFHDKGMESVEAVHGHNGNTRILWD